MKKKTTAQNILWESENIFYHKSNISRIGKLLYQYEIYKKITDLPGDILEFGVFKGASLIRFLTYRSILENNFSRKIIGFDTFSKFPMQKEKSDIKIIKEFTLDAGNPISKDELNSILIKKRFENFELIEGKVEDTLKKFIEKNRNTKISLLHLDMDVYKPTKYVLDILEKRIVKNGIILIDDYGTMEGATKALDEFLKKRNDLPISKGISLWKTYTERSLSFCENSKSPIFYMSFEDLLQSPQNQCEKLFKFLGTDFDETVIDKFVDEKISTSGSGENHEILDDIVQIESKIQNLISL